MTDNFHGWDCALRHNGDICTCGAEIKTHKTIAQLEKENATLRDALKEAQELLSHIYDCGSDFSHDIIGRWLTSYPLDNLK